MKLDTEGIEIGDEKILKSLLCINLANIIRAPLMHKKLGIW